MGSYLGTYERTDQYGNVLFTIPVKSYKFRVDYDGTQYWSNVINVIADEEQTVELPLDQLALNQTNNPHPKRFDGAPPKFEPKKIMVAGLGSITGLLTQTIIAQTGSDTVYYFINDHLGTPQKIIDENNEIVWAADYMPFGETNITINTLDNNFRFPGQYYDEETGLHYNYFRYYDTKTGRYMRTDPHGEGVNFYVYCLNDPVQWIDPLGLFKFGKRPLSKGEAPWFPGGSKNPLDDYFNTELSHEHGFFEDGSGDNVGFGPEGRFSENPYGEGYRYDAKHYDDNIMREALNNIEDGVYSNIPGRKNNCQDWCDRLRKEYNRILRERYNDNKVCK